MLGGNRLRISIVTIIVALVSCTHHNASAQMNARSGMGGMGGGAPGGAGPAGPQKQRRYIPPKFAPSGPRIDVADVVLKGNFTVSESRVRAKLQTREGRQFDPATVQADVRHLISSGLCYDVETFRNDTPAGVVVTFELFEQPLIQSIEFVGNRVRSKTLLKKSEIAVGQPLSRYRVEEAKRKLEDFYRSRGNSYVKINIQQGTEITDRNVVFQVEEGPRQRIRWTKFEGNEIASDARLRTQIDSKPGVLWLFKGQVDNDVIDEDTEKLISYYRSLGYFNATVRKELNFDKDDEWLNLTFHIDEGPRYKIRSINVDGNQVFEQQDLLGTTEITPGDYFDLTKINGDVRALKDTYGANGYIKANVNATPRFDEEPGMLDLVYEIKEGKQYRVGKIEVRLDGEHPHTRQTVVLNRIDMRQGDIIDSRKLRDSERRIKSSQLFETGPMSGPQISVVPRDSGTLRASRDSDTYR